MFNEFKPNLGFIIISYLSIKKIIVRSNIKGRKDIIKFLKLFYLLPKENKWNIWTVSLSFSSSYVN